MNIRPHSVCLTSVAVVVLLLASVGPVLAASTVAVVGVHGGIGQSDEELRALTEDLSAGFRLAGLEVVEGENLAVRLAGTSDRLIEAVYLAPARKAFDEGRGFYDRAQPEAAIEALTRADKALQGHEEFVRDPRLFADVQLFLGLAWLSLGNRSEARRAFARVVLVDPQRVLDTLDYPPSTVAVFDEVRTERLSGRVASVSVQAPEGATGGRVYLDGRMVGIAPVQVNDLPPGVHTILVDGGQHGRWVARRQLRPGEEARLRPVLTRQGLSPWDEELQSPRSSATRRLYRELALLAGTDLVAVAAFDEAGDLRIALYSGRTGTFSVDASASLSAVPGARSAFVRQLVERIALYADREGAIKEERVSPAAVPMWLGRNPVLTDHLFGEAPELLVAATAPVEQPVERTKRSTVGSPRVLGIVLGIVAGAAGIAGAGVGVWAATEGPQSQGGTLVIVVP